MTALAIKEPRKLQNILFQKQRSHSAAEILRQKSISEMNEEEKKEFKALIFEESHALDNQISLFAESTKNEKEETARLINSLKSAKANFEQKVDDIKKSAKAQRLLLYPELKYVKEGAFDPTPSTKMSSSQRTNGSPQKSPRKGAYQSTRASPARAKKGIITIQPISPTRLNGQHIEATSKNFNWPADELKVPEVFSRLYNQRKDASEYSSRKVSKDNSTRSNSRSSRFRN